jgi:type VI secretion system protein ImpL
MELERKLLFAGLSLLLIACFALAAWIMALTGQNPLLAVAAFGVLVTFLLLLFVVSRLRASRSAGQLERGLREQANAQLKATRPDRRHEIQQLQNDFEGAIRDLKSSRLGRAGRDALYLLPWYAIIGPSGAGKTTALRNSGLRFPSMRNQDNLKVKGVGGTRNCDFWLTNDAVLLDTAGRWSTQDEDQHEWLGFLSLLRKHRARKPLNGLIAAIGIGDVVNASEAEIDALAQRMRDRLEEVTNELRVSIPVYVLFTKCDLLEGFVEMFGGLRATEREQILGFTVPLSRADAAAHELFDEHFDELSETLSSASLTRMGEERAVRARQLVHAFPGQFGAARRNLGRFVSQLFESNVYRDSMPLRGVYFSSGTQEGRPFSLLLQPRAEADAAGVVDQKGYFLRELFMHVIFEDSEIASASPNELRRQRTRRMLLSGAFALVTLAVGVVPASAFLRSRHQLDVTTHRLVAAESGTHANVEPTLGPALKDVLADVERYDQGAPGWLQTLGMYTGGRILPLLHRYAATLVRRELVRPVVARSLQVMNDFGVRYEVLPRAQPSQLEHDTQYDLLKMHLLLSAPRLPKEYAGWVAEQLTSSWVLAAPGRAGEHLAHAYTEDAQQYPELAFTQDADVVRRVRAALTRNSAAQQALDAIVAHVGTLGYDLDLQKLTGYTSALIGTRRVRGAFTRRGWERVVRQLFETGAPDHVDEFWVLGRSDDSAGAAGQSDRAARLAELETLYFRTYVQEWRSFLDGVHTKGPRSGGAEALSLLSELTAGEPTPIGRLFEGVHQNVRLPVPAADPANVAAAGKPTNTANATDLLTRIWNKAKAPAAKRGAAPSAAPEPVQHFGIGDLGSAFEGFTEFGVQLDAADGGRPSRATVPYDAYREQLAFLRDALQLRLENPAESQQLEARIQTALVRVRGLIDSQPVGFRPVFEALLWPPIRGLREGASREGASWVGQQWCSEVVTPFEQTLLGHYPFSANGRDARVDDIDAFYRPGDGALWKFTTGSLADQVQLAGEGYGFTPKFQHGGGLYSRGLLEFLDRSRDIARAFYPNNARSPRVEFAVRIHGTSSKVDTTTFSVGGKRISYDNGPLTWQTLSWPGPEPAKGAAFSVRGHAIRAGNDMQGVWGLFRLLETGEVERSGEDAISVSWRLPADDVRVSIELRPAHGDSPFFDPQDAHDHGNTPRLMRVLRGPSVSAPHRVANGQGCAP